MTPEARLTRALELIYRVDNLKDLQDIADAVEYRRVYLQQQRDDADTEIEFDLEYRSS
jgi:hypothetical protein